MPSTHALLAALLATAVFAGCGNSPPSDKVAAAIQSSVLHANTAMFDGDPASAEVSFKLGSWKEDETQIHGGPTSYNTDWTATLRFKEPIACILEEVDGNRIVQVAADKGYELQFTGHAAAMNWENKWEVNSYVGNNGDFAGPGAWKPIWEKTPCKAGYQVFGQGGMGNPKFRTVNYEPLSKLKPCIVEGSPEHQKLQAARMERLKQAQDAALVQQQQRQAAIAAQQKQAADDQARIQAENVEKQRLAVDAQKRLQAEAAEKQRLAAEEQKRKAEEQHHARLLAVMKPFQGKTGAVLTTDAGPTLSSALLASTVDEANLTVTGSAIDLRELPFREFSFDGAVDDKGVFTWKAGGGDPVVFGAVGDRLVSRTGQAIAGLSDADRAKVDAAIALGKRLAAAPPAELAVESLDADAAKAREPQIHLSPLAGTVFFRGKVAANLVPLFVGDLAASRAYSWKGHEVVAIRLSGAVQGPGLYIRGGAAAGDNLEITINGVHKVSVASIQKLGGAIVTLPAGLEVFDLRLEAAGSVQARTIGLIKPD
jgi:hypothetical protein